MKRHKITISIDTEGSYGTTYQATGTVTSEQLVEVFHNIRELRMMSENRGDAKTEKGNRGLQVRRFRS
jgi:hypothetical protein